MDHFHRRMTILETCMLLLFNIFCILLMKRKNYFKWIISLWTYDFKGMGVWLLGPMHHGCGETGARTTLHFMMNGK